VHVLTNGIWPHIPVTNLMGQHQRDTAERACGNKSDQHGMLKSQELHTAPVISPTPNTTLTAGFEDQRSPITHPHGALQM
jgi:hypothetical protein